MSLWSVLRCQGCGVTGPARPTDIEADDAATGAGWALKVAVQGQVLDFCPTCKSGSSRASGEVKEKVGGKTGEDTRIAPLPPIALRDEQFAGIRVWPATKPIYDSTDEPSRSTSGFHVHAYSKTEFYEKGGEQHRRKVIDETHEGVTIGNWIAKAPAPFHDEAVKAAIAKVEHEPECNRKGLCQANCSVHALQQLVAKVTELRTRKDNAYEERNRVVARLAKMAMAVGFRAGIMKTNIPDWDAEWHNCVYIDLPESQVSWHMHDSQVRFFDWLPLYAGTYDEHTTDQKYARLDAACHGAVPEAALRETLMELVRLKDIKEQQGATPEYEDKKVVAWAQAKKVVGG